MNTGKDFLSLLCRSTWLEIDLDAISHNMRELRKLVGPDVRIIPAVKSNGYGHGMVRVCRTLVEAGADILGCGSVENGAELREAGIRVPILVFSSNTLSEVSDSYVRFDLIPTILEVDQAEAISKAAKRPVNVFVKIDTGRGRLGVLAEEALAFFQALARVPNIRIMGAYSHMADPNWEDRKPEFAQWQIKRFRDLFDRAKESGLNIPIWQIANSAAAISMPNAYFSGCCPGRAIYGYSQLETRPAHPELRRALRAWKSRIIQKKRVTAGKFGARDEAIRLESPCVIGVIATGLYDGLFSAHAKGGEVLVRGKRARVWSSVSFEHTVIDLSNCPEAQPGDEVVLVGRQGQEEIKIEDLMQLWKASLTQVLGHLNVGMTRIYFQKETPIGLSTKFGYRDL